MDRALASGARGHRFKSCQARHLSCVCVCEDVQKVHPARPQAARTSRRTELYVGKCEQRERSWWAFSTSSDFGGPLAQLAEQLTLNQRVVGSTPTRPTIIFHTDLRSLTPAPIFELNTKKPLTLQAAECTGANHFVGY